MSLLKLYEAKAFAVITLPSKNPVKAQTVEDCARMLMDPAYFDLLDEFCENTSSGDADSMSSDFETLVVILKRAKMYSKNMVVKGLDGSEMMFL